MSVPIFEASYNSATDTYITIKLNGHVRTVVRSLAFFDEGSTLEFNKEYEMCRRPEEYEDGRFWLRMDDGSCAELHNPLVHFYPDSGTHAFSPFGSFYAIYINPTILSHPIFSTTAKCCQYAKCF